MGRCSRGANRLTTSPSSEEDDDDDDDEQVSSSGVGKQSYSRPLQQLSWARNSTSLSSSSMRSSHYGRSLSSPRDLLKTPVARLINPSSDSDAAAEGEGADDTQSTLRGGASRGSSRSTGSRSSFSRRRTLQDVETPSRAATREDSQKRRREERDRLIRQRIEHKRLAAAGAAQATAARSTASASKSQDASIRAEEEGSLPPSVLPSSEPMPLTASTSSFTSSSHQRERSFSEDVSRLHRISHPPSVNSVAAFAAQVSPSKSEARRAALQRALQAAASQHSHSPPPTVAVTTSSPRSSSLGLDLPPLPSSSEDRSSTSILQEGIRLLNKDQLAKKRQHIAQEQQEEDAGRDAERHDDHDNRLQVDNGHLAPSPTPTSPSPSASPTGFSFTPQRMLKVASPQHSSSSSSSSEHTADSPRRGSHRRRRGGGSDIVSLNARVPPSSASEARRKLAEVLGPANEEQKERGDASVASSAPGDVSVVAPKKAGRKSVRFSPDTEYVEPAPRVEEGDEEQGDSTGGDDNNNGGEDSDDNDDDDDEHSQIDLDDALDKIAAQERESEPATAEPIVAETNSAPAPAPAPSLAASPAPPTPAVATPVRLPPGAFNSPARGVSGNDNDEASLAARSPFSQHILRRPTSKLMQVSTPNGSTTSSLAETPMMPGGLRFNNKKPMLVGTLDKNGQLSPPLRRRLHAAVDRGLPPSYSAVTGAAAAAAAAMGHSSHSSMSLSNSVDGSLGVLGEEDEAEEEAQELQGTTSGGIDVIADDGDTSVWQEGDDDDGDGDDPLNVCERSISPPRASTPPVVLPGNESSIRASGSSHSLDNLKPIDSAPSSPRAGTPEIEPAIDAKHSPSATSGVHDADESLRLTLETVVETLKGRMQTREERHGQANVDGEGTGPPVAHTRSPAEKPAADSELCAALFTRLESLKVEVREFESKLAHNEETDVEQLQRLRTTREMLQSGIDFLSQADVGAADMDAVPPPPSTSLSRRIKFATLAAIVQALLIWLSLVAIRHASDHLFRTVYYDPFYPHIYDTYGASVGAIDVGSASVQHSALPLGMVRVSPASRAQSLRWWTNLAARIEMHGVSVPPAALWQHLKSIPSHVAQTLLASLVDSDYGASLRTVTAGAAATSGRVPPAV